MKMSPTSKIQLFHFQWGTLADSNLTLDKKNSISNKNSELLWWEKIGKVVNWVKLAILSHSVLLLWKMIQKVVTQVKLAIPSHFDPLQCEKIGKVSKLAILSHSELLQWEKIGKVVN